VNLPPIDQVGFVVEDVHEAIEHYTPLFGEFTLWEPTDINAADYRGRSADCRLHIAVAQSGDVEIELIQWLDGDSPHAEAAHAGRFGMHHLRYRVEDADAAIRAAADEGFEVIWYKQWDASIKFAYLERPGDPLLIEFLQMPAQ
jgi:hypothetical protein